VYILLEAMEGGGTAALYFSLSDFRSSRAVCFTCLSYKYNLESTCVIL